MTDIRRDKVMGIDIPDQPIEQGQAGGKLVVVGWGSTYGPIAQAVRRARAKGHDVSHVHIRHIWPLPSNLGDLLKSYEHVLVPEMNTGQLKTLLRDQFLVNAVPLNKVSRASPSPSARSKPRSPVTSAATSPRNSAPTTPSFRARRP
jgi:2-oxoglutarate ferredoxin oxidoreductase subunit alpha